MLPAAPLKAGFATEIHDSDDEDGAALPGAEVKAKTRQDFDTEEEWLKYKETMCVRLQVCFFVRRQNIQNPESVSLSFDTGRLS